MYTKLLILLKKCKFRSKSEKVSNLQNDANSQTSNSLMGPHNSKRISNACINNKIPKNPPSYTSSNLSSSVCEINMQVNKE